MRGCCEGVCEGCEGLDDSEGEDDGNLENFFADGDSADEEDEEDAELQGEGLPVLSALSVADAPSVPLNGSAAAALTLTVVLTVALVLQGARSSSSRR